MKPHMLLVTLGIAILAFVIGVELGRRTVPRPQPPAAPAAASLPTPAQAMELILDGPAPRGDVSGPVQLLKPVEPQQVATPPLQMPAAPEAQPAQPAPLARVIEKPTAIRLEPTRRRPVATQAPTAPPPVSTPLVRIVQRPAPATTPEPPRPTAAPSAAAQPEAPTPAQAAVPKPPARLKKRWRLNIAPAARTPAPKEPAPVAASPAETAQGQFVVQVISMRERHAADGRVALLKAGGVLAFVESVDLGGKGMWYRVLAGAYPSEVEAKAALTTLRGDPQYATSFVRTY